MIRERITIKEITCESCVKPIKKRLLLLNGVKDVKVNTQKNIVTVKFNPELTSLKQIKSELNKLGYLKETDLEFEKNNNSILKGILYGLIPHVGCIAFIVGSIFGVTILMNFFKPLLLSSYFFHALILMSFLFATISASIYLKQNKSLSYTGIKKKWKYLSLMFGSTIGINIILFLFIFPLVSNISFTSATTSSSYLLNNDPLLISLVRLEVDIPCSGHAPLISQELKTINGVKDIKYSFPNKFNIEYDVSKTNVEEILLLDIFKSYPANVISDYASG